MATDIDSLQIQINADSEKAGDKIDELCDKITMLATTLGSLGKGKVTGLEYFQKATQNVTKSLSEITEKYKDLGKGFELKGSTEYLQKKIDSLSNSLAKATIKKKELETSENTGGKMYEYAVRDTIKFGNMIESLKKQLQSMEQKDYEFKITIKGLDNYKEEVSEVSEQIRTAIVSSESMGYNPQAIEFVNNYSLKIETLGEKLAQLEIPDIREENLKKLDGTIEKTEAKLEELRVKLANGLTMGRITESEDDSGYVRLQEQIALTEKQLEALQIKKTQVESSSGGSALNPFQGKLSGIASVGGKVKSALLNIFSAIGKLAKGFASAVGKAVNFTKSLLKTKSASRGLSSSLGGGLKSILQYGLGIRSLYVLFNKLRNAIKEGMKNLVQYSSETNSSVSLLKNSMTQLKNASASMVAPLLNAFAPALNQIIQLCVKAANSVNQLLSAITGKSTWIKAKTLTDDYASSLNKASKAAKGSTRAFDELKVINSNSDSGSSGTSAKDMFETVNIESQFMGMAERIKQMWTDADFTELGVIIGGKLKGALDNIDWESIKESGEKIGKSIATFINGAVKTESVGETIGTTIGESINTGIYTANSFIDNTNFSSIGLTLSDSLNGIINTIDFAEAGRGFGEGIKGILDIAIEFLENTDWQELGNKCAEFIKNVDWSGIADRLFEGIGAALGGLVAFLWGLIEDAWNNVVDWWYDTAYEDGEFTMSGLLAGIWEKIKDIGMWIYEHIFEPFIDGFKNAFGIHSPSTVMKEQGNFIMQGLLDGISSLVQKVIDKFAYIKDKIIAVWNTLKQKTKDIWNGMKDVIKKPINSIIGFINGMIKGVVTGINTVIKALNKIKVNIPSWVPVYGGKKFGFDLSTMSTPSIPYLANGAVFKGGNPYLAVVNDQPKGQTNIEAPLKTIQMALREEMNSNYGYASSDMRDVIYSATYNAVYDAMSKTHNSDIQVQANISMDGEPIYRKMLKKAREDYSTNRKSRFILAEEIY